MKVLLLTVSAGYGHTATAKAIEDMLASRGMETKTIDTYKYINKLLSETLDKTTAIYAKVTPDIYRMIYEYLDKGSAEERLNLFGFINSICSSKLGKLINEYQPDVIVCTHVFAAQIVDEIKRQGRTKAMLVGIITDYTIHPYWESLSNLDYCITANEYLTYRAIKKGIPSSSIKPLGIPVHPKFSIDISKEEARSQLGLSPTGSVALIMGGGLGYGFGQDELLKILDTNPSIEVMIVCGKAKRLEAKFNKLKDGRHGSRIKVYGFIDNIHVCMSAADVLISKPGGLSVSEAFAKNLPIIMVNPIAGHEERNAEFLMNCGLAMFANKTFPIDEAVHIMLTDPRVGERIVKSIDQVIVKNSTEKICDFIETLNK